MEELGEEPQVIGVEKGTGDKILSQYQTNERFHSLTAILASSFPPKILQFSSLLFWSIFDVAVGRNIS
jgi:hypothetical protein